MKTSRVFLLAALVVSVMLGQSALAADVLDHVPADSMVVVKVRNIKATSQKVAEFAQATGINEFWPELSDPLGSFQQNTKTSQGVDTAGDLAFVMVDPKVTKLSEDNSAIVLIPVTDYKAFIGNFQDPKVDGDITEATTPQGEQMFFAQRGSHAAMSPSKEVLAIKSDGLKIEGLAARELQSKDAIAYVNFEVVRREVLPKIKNEREKFVDDLAKGFQQSSKADEKTLKLVKMVANHFVDAAEIFITDTKAATWGVTITKSGLNFTALGEFAPESQMSGVAASFKNSDKPVLNGLPDAKFLYFGGANHDPAALGALVDKLTAPFIRDFTEFGPEAKPLLDWAGAFKSIVASSDGGAFGLVAPAGPLGQGSLVQMVGLYRGDSAKIKAAQQTMFQSQPDVMKLFGTDQGGQVKTTFTSNAKEVEGVKLDLLQTQFAMEPKTPEERQAAQMIAFIYGPTGLNGYSGAVTDKTAILAQGLSDDMLKTAILAAREDANKVGEKANIKVVDAELPKERFAALYVPLDTIAMTMFDYARQFGFGVPVQMPPDLPPIGITFSSEANAVRGDMHVPQQLIQSLVAAGMQVYAQMQGGPGGGGGGGMEGPGGL